MHERNLALRGKTVSSAAARIAELAEEMDYNAVPTAPRTYQLIRQRRRRLLGKRVETMTIALLEDRSGTRARITGDIDDLFLEHFGGKDAANDIIDVRPKPTATMDSSESDRIPTAVQSAQIEAPVRERRPPRPAGTPGAMIATVPGAARRFPEPAPDHDRQAPTVVTSGARRHDEQEPVERTELRSGSPAAEHTVMRSWVDLAPVAPAVPSLRISDGRIVLLDRAVVLGRNPDPFRAEVPATLVAVDDLSMSKTHALVEIVDGELLVVDLHSSNGSWVEVGSEARRCDPGEPLRLPVGPCMLRLGDAVIDIRTSS